MTGFNSIDNLFRDKLYHREVDFNQSDWDAAVKMMNSRDKKRKGWFGVKGLLVISGIAVILLFFFQTSGILHFGNSGRNENSNYENPALKNSNNYELPKEEVKNKKEEFQTATYSNKLSTFAKVNKVFAEKIPTNGNTIRNVSTQNEKVPVLNNLQKENSSQNLHFLLNPDKTNVDGSGNGQNFSAIQNANISSLEINPLNETQIGLPEFFTPSVENETNSSLPQASKTETEKSLTNNISESGNLSEGNKIENNNPKKIENTSPEKIQNNLVKTEEVKKPLLDRLNWLRHFSFGVSGGANFSRGFVNTGSSGASVSVNPTGGVRLACQLNEQVDIETGLLYDYRSSLNSRITVLTSKDPGTNTSHFSTNSTLSLHYLDLPVHLTYKYGKHSFVVGMQYARLINTHSEIINSIDNNGVTSIEQSYKQWNKNDGRFSSFDLAAILGYEYEITSRIKILGRYNYGLFDVTDDNSFNNSVRDKNHQFKIMVDYRFVKY